MRIRTLQEARRSLAEAKQDLQTIEGAIMLRSKLGIRDHLGMPQHRQLLNFYLSQWPEHGQDPDARQKWSNCLDMKAEWLAKYINTVESFIKKKMGRDPRLSLPKKEQRKLGLLPEL